LQHAASHRLSKQGEGAGTTNMNTRPPQITQILQNQSNVAGGNSFRGGLPVAIQHLTSSLSCYPYLEQFLTSCNHLFTYLHLAFGPRWSDGFSTHNHVDSTQAFIAPWPRSSPGLTPPSSFQWCPVTGQGAMGTN